jgi:hypothetical protein
MTFLPDAFEFVFDAFLFARTDCWADNSESSKDRMIAAAVEARVIRREQDQKNLVRLTLMLQRRRE